MVSTPMLGIVFLGGRFMELIVFSIVF